MTKTLRLSGLLAAVMLLPLSAPAKASDTYKLDPNHTAITWHISHFGFSSPSGKFMNVDGAVTLDEASPANSKVTVTIPVNMIDTGVPKLDEHLKTDQFFDAAKYPTATFTSDKVEITGKDSAKVDGNLTLHGVTKPVVLNVKLNKLGMNMMNKKTVGFSATANLKRSDYGMTTYLPGLGDDVAIDIESEANLAP